MSENTNGAVGSGEAKLKFSNRQGYDEYILILFENLSFVAKTFGIGPLYEDTLDDGWGGLPSLVKEPFITLWLDAEKIDTSKIIDSDMRDAEIRRRCNLKRQIITDAVFHNRFLIKVKSSPLLSKMIEAGYVPK